MNVKRFMKKGLATLKKHSPEILMGVGCVSLVGAVGTAIWKTATCDEILNEHEERMDRIEAANKKASESNGVIVYSDEDKAADTIKFYALTVRDMAWHYLPTIALTAVSITSFLGAFSIMKSRYTVVSTTLAATTAAFEKYRKRVVEKEGKDADIYYMTGAKKEKINVLDENGKKTGEKAEILVVDDENAEADHAPFEYIFDERSGEFYKDQISNLSMFNGKCSVFNMDLSAEGIVYARDVAKSLDIWKYLSKEERNRLNRFGWIDDGETTVELSIRNNAHNKEALKDCYGRLADPLWVEFVGMKEIDGLIP